VLTIDQAADYILFLCSPDVFDMMRVGRDWSFDQSEEWLAGVLTRLLLD
jgi:hypothetical protein